MIYFGLVDGQGTPGIGGAQDAHGARWDVELTPNGEVCYWPFPGDDDDADGHRLSGAAGSRRLNERHGVTDWHPVHEAVGRRNMPAPGSRLTATRSEQKIIRYPRGADRCHSAQVPRHPQDRRHPCPRGADRYRTRRARCHRAGRLHPYRRSHRGQRCRA